MGYVTKKVAQRFEEKKAAIYVRVSTQYQVDRASLPVQREELINYAKYALPHTDGSRDASMESSENASIFKTQECLWFRLKRYHCIQRLFVSVQQKSPVWGLFVRHSTAYFYFSRYLPIMQPLFGRYQRPSVKLTPAKSSAVKT